MHPTFKISIFLCAIWGACAYEPFNNEISRAARQAFYITIIEDTPYDERLELRDERDNEQEADVGGEVAGVAIGGGLGYGNKTDNNDSTETVNSGAQEIILLPINPVSSELWEKHSSSRGSSPKPSVNVEYLQNKRESI